MSDPKREKGLRQIASLRRLIEHPSTGDGERAAAQNRLETLCAKWDQPVKRTTTQPPPRTPPRQNTSNVYRPWQDRTGGYNSTSDDSWSKMEEEFRRAGAAAKEAADKARAEREAEAVRTRNAARAKAAEEQRQRRAEAQRQWEAKMAGRDAMGRPITEADREEARRDPLGWAMKQDGRTMGERNDDMQKTRRGQPLPKCRKPETFFDPGGEPRKRNDFPMDCVKCGSHLLKSEGAIFKVGGKWFARCCEKVPGPRKKKPGRG